MFIVCGEALVDVFARGASDGVALEVLAGGSPFNLAIGLARSGVRTAYLGTLSCDVFGDFLCSRLSEAGVDLALTRRCSEPTALSVVSTGRDGQPVYAFYAGDTADRALRPQDLPAVLPADVIGFACGSYALGVEPIASAIETFVTREGPRLAVSLDPNVRPRVVGDLAAFRARFERLLARSALVKASREDVELLYGAAAAPDVVARGWLARGVALVVVTDGAAGAYAYWGDHAIRRAVRAVQVVDTVGAGDALHATLLAHLAEQGWLSRDELRRRSEADIAAALDRAIAAAAIVCGRRGADPPRRAELDALMAHGS